MRILSIDYGKKRTGIAVTDSLQIIANGLTTVDTSDLIKFLKEYTAKEAVERFVLGLPTQPNGQPSDNLPRVQAAASLGFLTNKLSTQRIPPTVSFCSKATCALIM